MCLFSYNKTGDKMNDKFDGVVIDPGHGGVDGGAKGKDILEKAGNGVAAKTYLYYGRVE